MPVLAESVLPRAPRLVPGRESGEHPGDDGRVPSPSSVVRERAELRLPRTPHRRMPRRARGLHPARAARRGGLRGMLRRGVLLERRLDGADVRPHPGPLRGDADVRLLPRGPSRSRTPRLRRARGAHRRGASPPCAGRSRAMSYSMGSSHRPVCASHWSGAQQSALLAHAVHVPPLQAGVVPAQSSQVLHGPPGRVHPGSWRTDVS